jgi:hypothetical protein
MSNFFKKKGLSIDANKIAKNIDMCVFLLDKIENNDYSKSERRKQDDIDLFCEIFKRELLNWWD